MSASKQLICEECGRCVLEYKEYGTQKSSWTIKVECECGAEVIAKKTTDKKDNGAWTYSFSVTRFVKKPLEAEKK